jgi:hypothetical protein
VVPVPCRAQRPGLLDRFIFGNWLTSPINPVHLVGARLVRRAHGNGLFDAARGGFDAASATTSTYEPQPGQTRPTADFVSERSGESPKYGVVEVLTHPRYKLHVVTSRACPGREQQVAATGYLGAF